MRTSKLRTLSLRERIFWLSAGSTLLILLATFTVVDEAFRETIIDEQREAIEAQAELFSAIYESQVADGIRRTRGLAELPIVIEAVNAGDFRRVGQILRTAVADSRTLWLAVATTDGEILAEAGTPPGEAGRPTELSRLLTNALDGAVSELHHHGDELTDILGVRIPSTAEAPYILLTGTPFELAPIERLGRASNQTIGIATAEGIVLHDGILNDRDRSLLMNLLQFHENDDGYGARTLGRGDFVRRKATDRSDFLAAAIPLFNSDGSRSAKLVVYRSVRDSMAPADRIRSMLGLLAVLAILISFGAAYALATRITRPLDELLRETRRMVRDELVNPIAFRSDDELGRLAAGIEKMRKELLEARTELIRTERLSALGQAASAIVHDFRQPVTVIQNSVSMLRFDRSDPKNMEEDIIAIESQVNVLDAMMKEILDFAKGADSMHPTTQPLTRLLDEIAGAVNPVFVEKQISLSVHPGFTGEWTLDFPRTRRVIENLVRNAAAVLPPGGSVTVRTDADDEGLCVQVEDTGPGIPEEIRDRLFEPFVTHGKREGTGLGLAIVKSFTEKQGGTVSVQTSSHGTRFELRFPKQAA